MSKNVFGQAMNGFAEVVPDERHDDTKRIDWLETQCVDVFHEKGDNEKEAPWQCGKENWTTYEWEMFSPMKTLRQAIDIAMMEGK